jgi:hypothetical protein
MPSLSGRPHKNDFRDAHAVAEAVQRPTTRCVPPKTDEQLDLQAQEPAPTAQLGQAEAEGRGKGKYVGPENTECNAKVAAMLRAVASYSAVQDATGCGRATVAKIAKRNQRVA